MRRMECKQHLWNRSSSLICFRQRTQVSAPYRRVGMTMALYTWIFVERRSEWLCYTVFDSLPKELLALDSQLSRPLLTVALEMMPPREVKCSTVLEVGAISEEGFTLLVEGVSTTPHSSSGWWWGRSSWLHQSSWQCAVGLPPCGQEGCSHQQTAAQWWVPWWFSCMQGDAEGWRDYCLFGNGCRCCLTGPLLPHEAWCWRRWRTIWGPGRNPA